MNQLTSGANPSPSLRQLLCAHSYDIIAIKETWLKRQYAN